MLVLNKRIKELRKSKNLTQKQFAEILDVQISSVKKFENGTRRPVLDKLIVIADYFHVSLDYLVGRTENSEVNQ